ncbi:MAG TPA: ABC transporter ATP-binding protein [Thermodesulfobacteriota bacterium]
MNLLEVRGLEVRFGDGPAALVVEALDVAAGETLAVIGPNGSGKSTLFAALACVRPWDAGRLTFEGRPVEPTGPTALDYRRRIATVMQQPLLLDMTALDNAAQGLRYRGVGRREARAKAQAWLDRLGIGHLASRRARHLSGGEAQRVSLARAMAIEPRLILLDEPFAPLDAPSRAAFIADLRRVLAETETTALLVTHDRSEALMLADRVAVLLGGRIVQVGTPTEVFEAPADERVAAFVGVETIQPGVLDSVDDGLGVVRVFGPGGVVSRVEVRTDLPAGSAVHVCVRPEDVAVSPRAAGPDAREGATSVRNRLPGVVRAVLPLEGQFRVTIDCGFPLVATVTKRAFVELGLAEGRAVVAAFKATAAHLVPRPPVREGERPPQADPPAGEAAAGPVAACQEG